MGLWVNILVSITIKGGVLLAHEKANLGKRLVAAVIDGLIAGVLSAVLPLLGIGSLLGCAYILSKDALMFELLKDPAWKGQSIGKRVMHLKVLGPRGKDVDIGLSAKRNWPLAIGELLSFIIAFMPVGFMAWSSWSLVAGISSIIAIIEIALVFTDPQGRRLGDRLADTRVMEAAEEKSSAGRKY